MANIWRQQPSRRLCVNNFIPDSATDASVLIANEFFEAVAGPTVTIVANDFPMEYYQGASPKELRSRVSGATITRVANSFPHELIKSGKAKELRSKWA